MKRLPTIIVKLFKTFVLFWGVVCIMKSGGSSHCEIGDKITLPAPRFTGDISVEQALRERRSVRSYSDEPLSVQEISQLLWAAQGITNERGYRTSPSGGALYPLETYLVVGNARGLSDGIYRYIPRGHSLEVIQSGDKRSELSATALGQSCVKDGAVIFVFSAVYERITKKYGERGIRYTHIEVGHAAQNVCLQAVSLDLGIVVVGAFRDEEVKKVVGMGKNEQPLYLIPVGKKTNL